MPVYTAELYPTAIRNAGVGACNVAAGVALIIVPYLSLLVRSNSFAFCMQFNFIALFFTLQNKIQPYFLMVLVASCSILGSLVVIFLPESMPHDATKRISNASQHSGDEQHEER